MDSEILKQLIAEELEVARHERERLLSAQQELARQMTQVEAAIHYRNGQVAALEKLTAGDNVQVG